MPNIEGFGNIPEKDARTPAPVGTFNIVDIKRNPPVPEDMGEGKEIISDTRIEKGE